MNRRAVLFAALALALAACNGSKSSAPPLAASNRLAIVSSDGKAHEFTIEVAMSEQEIENGLMFRTHLDADAGMLFYFGSPPREAAFWMKDTAIALDMIFIRADGTITRIHENAQPNDQTEVFSGGPVTGVLEINGGRSAALGIKAGDHVRSPMFGTQ